MTTDLFSNNKRDKPFGKNKVQNIYKINTLGWPSLSSHLFYREEKPHRSGGRGLGRYREIKDFFIDEKNRIFIGYSTDNPSDPGYQFIQYAAIGRLIVVMGKEAAV